MPQKLPELKAIQDYGVEDESTIGGATIEKPKSLVVKKTRKMASFTCEMDKDAVGLSWKFTSLHPTFKGAIIYQTKVGVSPYVSHLYRVDNFRTNVYTLVVTNLQLKTIGTYQCSILYTDKAPLTQSAQLVMAEVHPMILKVVNAGVASTAKFTCVVEFFGRMQPYLECTSKIILYPVKLLSIKETFKKVQFMVKLNYTQLPFLCDVWFKDDWNNSVLFQLGETNVKQMRKIAAYHAKSSGQNLLRASILNVLFHFLCLFCFMNIDSLI